MFIRVPVLVPPHEFLQECQQRTFQASQRTRVYTLVDGKQIFGLKTHQPLKGSFAYVKFAETAEGTPLARRICKIHDPADALCVQKSLAVLGRLQGKEGIIPYYGHVEYVSKKNIHKTVLFFDRAKSDFFEVLSEIDSKPFSKAKQLSYASQLLKIFYTLQDEGAHGDVKPENILVSLDEEKLYLADFDTWISKKGPYRLGTFRYMAPEVLFLGKCKDIEKVDVWALGIILFFIFSNTTQNQYHLPWVYKNTGEEVKDAIRDFQCLTTDEKKQRFQTRILDPNILELLLRMIETNWKLRFTVQQAYEYFQAHIQ